MKTNWNDITIAEHKEISNIQKSDREEMNKVIAIIAVLEGKSEEEIYNMPIGKLKPLIEQLSFLNTFDFPKNIKMNKLKIGDWELDCDINMKEFSVAQYIDFQQYWMENNKDLARILSIFYIPKGLKYNEGYDVDELVHTLEQNMSIVQANATAFFLVKKLWKSTRFSRLYLEFLSKRLTKKMKKMKKVIST